MNRHALKRGFSLVELLVVVAVIAVLAYVGLGAFPSMLRASDRSLAANQLRVGLGAARDAAIRGDGGDSAAVFIYDPVSRRTSIVPCVMVGTFKDVDPADVNGFPAGAAIDRELFVPLPNVDAVQLPANWLVSGFANEGMLDTPSNLTGWYVSGAANPDREIDTAGGAWVFPETDFYNIDFDPSTRRQYGKYERYTFMVRFAARTGAAMFGEDHPVAVLLARPTSNGRSQNPVERGLRPDLADNIVSWAKRVLSRPIAANANGSDQSGAIGLTLRSDVLGASRMDSVLAASVTSLGVVDARELATGMGIRANNRETGTAYQINTGNDTLPKWDPNAIGGIDKDTLARNIDQWMTGILAPGGTKAVTSDVQLFVVQAADGRPVPMTE